MTQEQIKAICDAMSTCTLIQYLVNAPKNKDNMIVATDAAVEQMKDAGVDTDIINHFDAIMSLNIQALMPDNSLSY